MANNNNNNNVASKDKDPKVAVSSTSEFEAIGFTERKEDFFVLGTVSAPAHEPEERSSRAPIDLVAVIDRSGSMAGQKLNLVKETLKFMLQQLKPQDSLSLITYETNVKVDIPLTQMTDANKAEATEIVEKIKDAGNTNLSGGLIAGLEQLMKKTSKNEVASVLLFTDGLANVGLRKTSELVNVVEKTRAQIAGSSTIFTFGFGADHDSNMLRSIAEAGKGLYYFIENADSIPESFADCIGGLMSVVAQNVSLTVEPLNNVPLKKAHTHYETSIQNGVTTIRLGDLYSEESRNVVCQITLPNVPAETERFEVLKFTLNYFNLLTVQHETSTAIAYVRRPATTPEGQKSDYFLDRQRNRLVAAEAIEESRKIADKGDLAKAREHLNVALGKINASPSVADDYVKAQVDDLNEALDGMNSDREYKATGQKKMIWKAQAH